jgi:putative iron-dependent peroxidase
MLENMFIGRPPGNYDRLLEFSRAVTGNLFFVPTATFLENITEEGAVVPSAVSPVAEPAPAIQPESNGSLHIGSLKGDTEHE